MGVITAETLCTDPYKARMGISDLGATETGVVLHPSSIIFNATMLGAGAMILAAAYFAHRACTAGRSASRPACSAWACWA